MVVAVILAAVIGAWSLHLRKQDEALSAEVQQLETELANVSVSLRDARRIRPHFQALIDGAGRMTQERDADKWTPALQSIATSAGAGIDLRVIHVVKKNGSSREHELQIQGVSMGTAPRVVADHFLQTLQRELLRHYQLAGKCRFEQLEDEPSPPTASAEQRKASFTITAPLGAAVVAGVEINPRT